MNAQGWTFKNCTLNDADGQPHMLIPMDMLGVYCYPGDMVCDECDLNCTHPFEIAGICTRDSGDGTQQYVIDLHGKFYFADEVFHVVPDLFSKSGFSMMK